MFAPTDYNQFLDTIFSNIKSIGIDVGNFSIDHIGFRPPTTEEYTPMLNFFLSQGVLLKEVQIRNRPISIVKLEKPISYHNYSIPMVEILGHLPNESYPIIEHVEFVVLDLDGFAKNYSHVQFNTNYMSDPVNPHLVLTFPNQANIKFHPLPMDAVIRIESK